MKKKLLIILMAQGFAVNMHSQFIPIQSEENIIPEKIDVTHPLDELTGQRLLKSISWEINVDLGGDGYEMLQNDSILYSYSDFRGTSPEINNFDTSRNYNILSGEFE